MTAFSFYVRLLISSVIGFVLFIFAHWASDNDLEPAWLYFIPLLCLILMIISLFGAIWTFHWSW